MRIQTVLIKNFRNFKDLTVRFVEKSLVIGANDIGKTNLIYALRILLDRTLSEADLEPQESDFYIHETINSFEILIEFVEVREDCVLSKMKGHVGEDANLWLGYRALRDTDSRKVSYELVAGRDRENLVKIESRYYLKVLNLKFIGSKRDLFAFIRTEKRNLLQEAKSIRTDDQIEQDVILLSEIEQSLSDINNRVRQLSYILEATRSVNAELGALSAHNSSQQVVFDTGEADTSEFVDNLRLVSQVNDKSIALGGDGRNNQIHLALWAARNRVSAVPIDEVMEVTLFCIEEPETHLHPHQQRKLSRYLSTILEAQVFITTHSPQIACEFPPNTIIRLYNNRPDTKAAGNGVNPFIEATLIDFGYRLNAISAEIFFASAVFLVEGPSEVLFYKALSRQIEDELDLDRLNISIQMVYGVGFKTYVSLLRSLNIPFVIRTDNDIFKVPRKEHYRFAGLQRLLEIYREFFQAEEPVEAILSEAAQLVVTSGERPSANIQLVKQFRLALEPLGLFLGDLDLEQDMFSVLTDQLRDHFRGMDDDDIVVEMQQNKATFMFDFLRNNASSLGVLRDESITKPLFACRKLVEPENAINS